MRPEAVPVQFARDEDRTVPVDFGLLPRVAVLIGCGSTILAAFIPWIEKATVGVSATTVGIQVAGIALSIVAAASASAVMVIVTHLRPQAQAKIAIALIVLGVLQLGVALWFGLNILLAIEQANSHLVLILAIGTGAYLGVIGSVITLTGGILLWIRLASDMSARRLDRQETQGLV